MDSYIVVMDWSTWMATFVPIEGDKYVSSILGWLAERGIVYRVQEVRAPIPAKVDGINFVHYYPNKISIAVEFHFESASDAVLFKLTWVGK